MNTFLTLVKCGFHSECSVVAHFWLILSLPESHVGKVTMQMVNESLLGILQSFRETGDKDTVNSEGYLLLLSSFSLSGNSVKTLQTPPQSSLHHKLLFFYFHSYVKAWFFFMLRFVDFHLFCFYRNPAQSYRFFASLIWYDIFNFIFCLLFSRMSDLIWTKSSALNISTLSVFLFFFSLKPGWGFMCTCL